MALSMDTHFCAIAWRCPSDAVSFGSCLPPIACDPSRESRSMKLQTKSGPVALETGARAGLKKSW